MSAKRDTFVRVVEEAKAGREEAYQNALDQFQVMQNLHHAHDARKPGIDRSDVDHGIDNAIEALRNYRAACDMVGEAEHYLKLFDQP